MEGVQVQTAIDNSTLIFDGQEELDITHTDSEGKAVVEFTNAFVSPLYIAVFSNDGETVSTFHIPAESITRNSTITFTDLERYVAGGAEGDEIELQLMVSNWSL